MLTKRHLSDADYHVVLDFQASLAPQRATGCRALKASTVLDQPQRTLWHPQEHHPETPYHTLSARVLPHPDNGCTDYHTGILTRGLEEICNHSRT